MVGWLVGWLFGWFGFLPYPATLGSPILYKETQFSFGFVKLNFTEFILCSVIHALPGGSQGRAFVCLLFPGKSLHNRSAAPGTPSVSTQASSPCGDCCSLFPTPGDTGRQARPDGALPPGWGRAAAKRGVLCLYGRY